MEFRVVLGCLQAPRGNFWANALVTVWPFSFMAAEIWNFITFGVSLDWTRSRLSRCSSALSICRTLEERLSSSNNRIFVQFLHFFRISIGISPVSGLYSPAWSLSSILLISPHESSRCSSLTPCSLHYRDRSPRRSTWPRNSSTVTPVSVCLSVWCDYGHRRLPYTQQKHFPCPCVRRACVRDVTRRRACTICTNDTNVCRYT